MTQELNAAALSKESATPAQPANAGTTATVGQALKDLRVAKGWSLEDVSSRIKFAPRQIQALEGEQWDKLPKGVSLRGLVRSYARLLDTDPAAIVSSVESQVGALSSPGSVHRVSRTIPVAVSGHSDSRSSVPWGWLLVIVVLLAVLGGYAFWQGWLPADWLPSWLSGAKP
ncbi:helix-turn-helix domain-containing protein [Bordetella genomosp. 4]|uniref:Transcriptional regulator n=1 Tax=Bordetella genomosp. 4 TaxID=463044 RepID=A0A261U817_9BORD|nr:helix-turn-helix transcriptional regulator [Bordetella genomosp. 4]OZI51377.1 transcriptional regulator [Bordetella genomosp. 4]OZI57562.1 transcriptional regulator [Bordetella genomosp. 4]